MSYNKYKSIIEYLGKSKWFNIVILDVLRAEAEERIKSEIALSDTLRHFFHLEKHVQ